LGWTLDEIDVKIIGILRERGRISYTDLGKEVGLSEGAARKRVQKLVESGYIERFTIETKTKEEIAAIILISVSTEVPTPEIAEKIRKIGGVETVYEVAGQFDVAALLTGEGLNIVNSCVDEIRRVIGVSDTNTLVVLRKWL
jgi:DNA-binding Lrp family transcriptional regulator